MNHIPIKTRYNIAREYYGGEPPMSLSKKYQVSITYVSQIIQHFRPHIGTTQQDRICFGSKQEPYYDTENEYLNMPYKHG